MAESVIRRQHIDVLISDIRMPGKSGLDLLSFVNRVSPHTLVVFMSAYSEFEYAKQAIENMR
ncbi:putative response regulatory protein [compost metagenome]